MSSARSRRCWAGCARCVWLWLDCGWDGTGSLLLAEEGPGCWGHKALQLRSLAGGWGERHCGRLCLGASERRWHGGILAGRVVDAVEGAWGLSHPADRMRAVISAGIQRSGAGDAERGGEGKKKVQSQESSRLGAEGPFSVPGFVALIFCRHPSPDQQITLVSAAPLPGAGTTGVPQAPIHHPGHRLHLGRRLCPAAGFWLEPNTGGSSGWSRRAQHHLRQRCSNP